MGSGSDGVAWKNSPFVLHPLAPTPLLHSKQKLNSIPDPHLIYDSKAEGLDTPEKLKFVSQKREISIILSGSTRHVSLAEIIKETLDSPSSDRKHHVPGGKRLRPKFIHGSGGGENFAARLGSFHYLRGA